MKLLSRFFSTVLHPLLMPIYGAILVFAYSFLIFYPMRIKLFVLGVIAVFTLIAPMLGIIILKALKLISSVSLVNREDRKYPYWIALLSYFLCILLLIKINLPLWVPGFICGGLLSLIVSAVITTKWKISAHLTGMGGLLGCALYLSQHYLMLPLWLLLLIIFLTGALGTSRIYLGRHTFGQVIAGSVNGCLCVYLFMTLI